ncbi:ribosomal protein L21-like protein [Phellopilus nigrolimitatus]|nr:ribosomal protein L21-like protein [Phellopilus nigrolimitatus]
MLSTAVRTGCVRQATQRYLSTTASASTSVAASVPTASSTYEALDHLRSQPAHYVVASLVGHKYLLAPRDLLTVARLKDVRVGDRLRLSEIHEVGSRDFTLRGAPTLPSGLISVEATVVEHTKGAMERIVKFKRRKHYQKTITHKQTYTRLRIGPIELGQAEKQAAIES